MPGPRKKRSGTRQAGKASRAPVPDDWLEYLRPIAEELPVVVELVDRLRWAHDLKTRGLSVAPWPAGHFRTSEPSIDRLMPGMSTVERPAHVHARLLTPEEMVQSLSLPELKSFLAEWEAEVREWGRAIWQKRKETLRLRQKRVDVMKDIAFVKLMKPDVGEMEAARLVHEARANPGVSQKSRSGAGMTFLRGLSDEFGNDLPGDLDPATVEELAEPPLDERALRRIVKGEHKRGRGGIYDIDDRLLRAPKPK